MAPQVSNGSLGFGARGLVLAGAKTVGTAGRLQGVGWGLGRVCGFDEDGLLGVRSFFDEPFDEPLRSATPSLSSGAGGLRCGAVGVSGVQGAHEPCPSGLRFRGGW
eukprot:scaffold26932_cov73-Isochrysis_galbana.AAC.1